MISQDSTKEGREAGESGRICAEKWKKKRDKKERDIMLTNVIVIYEFYNLYIFIIYIFI